MPEDHNLTDFDKYDFYSDKSLEFEDVVSFHRNDKKNYPSVIIKCDEKRERQRQEKEEKVRAIIIKDAKK